MQWEKWTREFPQTAEGKLEVAKAYLRSRGKLIEDLGCAFVPTDSLSTNIRKTFGEFRDNATREIVAKSRAKLSGQWNYGD